MCFDGCASFCALHTGKQTAAAAHARLILSIYVQLAAPNAVLTTMAPILLAPKTGWGWLTLQNTEIKKKAATVFMGHAQDWVPTGKDLAELKAWMEGVSPCAGPCPKCTVAAHGTVVPDPAVLQFDLGQS